MAKKKVLITALAIALVCVVAVAGTVAYLTAKSGNGQGVTNTFEALDNGKIADAFEIKETPVSQNPDGSYDFDSSASQTTSGQDYKILPGQSLPKDPTVTITNKTKVPVYVFLEENNTLTNIFGWEIDSSNWLPLKKNGVQVKGLNGGNVYYYAKNGSPVLLQKTDSVDDFSINILKDKKVTVDKDATESELSALGTKEITFYAYMGQAATGDDPVTVFENCEFVPKK